MKLFTKITIAVYAIVALATGICAAVFRDNIDLSLFSAIPAVVLIFSAVWGLMLIKGALYLFAGKWRLDLRYYKNEYEYENDEDVKNETRIDRFVKRSIRSNNRFLATVQPILGYILIMCGALTVPCIFFFSELIKLSTLGIPILFAIFSLVFSILLDAKQVKEDITSEKERSKRHQKELEEQKKKEEQGRWR